MHGYQITVNMQHDYDESVNLQYNFQLTMIGHNKLNLTNEISNKHSSSRRSHC